MSFLSVPGSRPYAWPFSGDMTGERLAVIVTGIQPELTESCAAWSQTLKVINRVVTESRRASALIVWVLHRASPEAKPRPGRAWMPHEPNDASLKLSAEVAEEDIVITACGVDAFYASCLDDLLRSWERSMLVFVGAGFETTVHSTMRSANDRGYECLTLLDAVASLDPNLTEAAASTICMSGGIFGAVAQSPAFLEVLAALPDDIDLSQRNRDA